ncbi:phospholipase D-like domain-containing protein [Gemmatimonas sp.]|uniref:phospholipase D-like domain-containing protein n=1 Tax=Gemmatimonas sp. TaxID=1962908 RepID=UPI003983647D
MTYFRRHPVVTVLATVLITALITVLVLNLSSGEKKIQERIGALYHVGDAQFLRSMGTLLGPPIIGGNRVTPLRNGVAIFPAMLEAIKAGKRTITFETFIYWSGSIGRDVADALSERARAGVKVHVLLDWVGSTKMEPELLERLERAGVEVRRYHPPRWYTLSKMNNRTHRKLLVIDGTVGFTGGVGIADPWLGDAQDQEHWRDSHYRLDGPAVAQMQAAFLDNWMKASGELLHGEEYFPALPSQGDVSAQLFRSDPGEGGESVRLMYLLSIASAKQSVRIAAAYFVPDDLSIETLVAARRRGVHVEIIVPGPLVDTELTRRASRARWGKLLAAGVIIHEYQPTMYHCKIMIVDDIWTSVGSTNFDNRSFRLNDEANLNVYDRAFAATQIADFDADRAQSRPITFEMWQKRPWREKLVEHAAALLRSQL